MAYCNTHLRNQLIASNLKINSFEIRDAIGFDNDWLAGLRFFFECCSRPEYQGLSQLLEHAEEHNQLVAAIEIDIHNILNVAVTANNDPSPDPQGNSSREPSAPQRLTHTKESKIVNFHPDKTSITQLNKVISTFSQTKQDILRALQRYRTLRDNHLHNSIENHIDVTSSPQPNTPPERIYARLMARSLQIATRVQTDINP